MGNDGHVTDISGMIHQLADLVRLLVWLNHVRRAFVPGGNIRITSSTVKLRIYVSKVPRKVALNFQAIKSCLRSRTLSSNSSPILPNDSRIFLTYLTMIAV
jgi:hypothetical protein